MSKLTIQKLVLSVDFGDKEYSKGNGRFASISAGVPEGEEGIPIANGDELITDGIEMYLTAWQTMMQTRYATGDISADTYKTQTAAFLVRIERIRQLYKKIKGKSTEELEAFLRKVEEHGTSEGQ